MDCGAMNRSRCFHGQWRRLKGPRVQPMCNFSIACLRRFQNTFRNFGDNMRPQHTAAIIGTPSFANHRFSFGCLASTSVILLHTTALVAIIAATVLSAAAQSAAQDGNEDETDHSIRRGNDFYRYANGAWLRTAVIPAGQSSYGECYIGRSGEPDRNVWREFRSSRYHHANRPCFQWNHRQVG